MAGRRASPLIIVVAAVSAACAPSDGTTERQTEVGRVRSDNVDVVLLSRQAALTQGRDSVTIEFRGVSDGSLVDAGEVKASATMPMPAMAPMFGTVDVQPTETPGRYVATSDLSMAGQWRLTVEWNGPAGRGSASFSPMVQ